MSTISFFIAAPQDASHDEASLLDSMRVLIELPATCDHVARRRQAVCTLLEVMYRRFAASPCASKMMWREGLQRLARLWLEKPPVITWHSSSMTFKQVWSWLKTSLERSVGAIHRKQRREQRRYHSLEAIQEDVGDHALRHVQNNLERGELRGAFEALFERAREVVAELAGRYASRSDVRRAIPAHAARLMELTLHPELDDWIRAHHPEQMEDAQRLRRFRDRMHTQHKRARKFLREALELYLEEAEVEQEVLTLLYNL